MSVQFTPNSFNTANQANSEPANTPANTPSDRGNAVLDPKKIEITKAQFAYEMCMQVIETRGKELRADESRDYYKYALENLDTLDSLIFEIMQEALDFSNSKKDDIREALYDLKNEYAHLQRQNLHLHKLTDKQKVNLKTAEAQIHVQSTKIQEVEAKLETLKKTHELSLSQINQLKTETTQLKTQNQELQNKALKQQDQTALIEKLRKEVKILKSENNGLKTEKETANKTIAQLNHLLKAGISERIEFKARFEQEQQKNVQQSEEINRLNNTQIYTQQCNALVIARLDQEKSQLQEKATVLGEKCVILGKVLAQTQSEELKKQIQPPMPPSLPTHAYPAMPSYYPPHHVPERLPLIQTHFHSTPPVHPIPQKPFHFPQHVPYEQPAPIQTHFYPDVQPQSGPQMPPHFQAKSKKRKLTVSNYENNGSIKPKKEKK